MTVVVYVLAGIGATTLLAAVALIGATCRETALCRHIDAQAPAPARVYDWECESDCPDCRPPLDPRDVALWGRQIMSADEDQIMREATK